MYRKMIVTLILINLLIIIIAPSPDSFAQDECDVEVVGEIGAKWTELGAEESPLGCPLDVESEIAGGRVQSFEEGYIFWSNFKREAYVLNSEIGSKWVEMGFAESPVGVPISGEMEGPNSTGLYVDFERGSMTWHPDYGVQAVYGAIGQKWNELGGVTSPLGFPTSDEQATADDAGRFNNFEHGTIYWRPIIGAYAVYGAIESKWTELEREAGPLNYPLSDEMRTADDIGRFNRFERGWIYWHPDYGPQAVYELLGAHWHGLGAETSVFGYPIEDNQMSEDGVGEYIMFENGILYLHPTYRVQGVYNEIAEKYLELGAETGHLGYPIQEELPTHEERGNFSVFENGVIYWIPEIGAYSLSGAFLDTWNAYGGELSFLGYPIIEAAPLGETEGQYTEFENGMIRIYEDDTIQTLLCKDEPNVIVANQDGTFNTLVSGAPTGEVQNLPTVMESQLANLAATTETTLIEQLEQQLADNGIEFYDLEVQLNGTGDSFVKANGNYLFVTIHTARNFMRFSLTTPEEVVEESTETQETATPDGSEAIVEPDPLITIFFDIEFTVAMRIPEIIPSAVNVEFASACLGNTSMNTGEVAEEYQPLVDNVTTWFDGPTFVLTQERQINDALQAAELPEMDALAVAINETLTAISGAGSHIVDLEVDGNTGKVTLIITPQ